MLATPMTAPTAATAGPGCPLQPGAPAPDGAGFGALLQRMLAGLAEPALVAAAEPALVATAAEPALVVTAAEQALVAAAEPSLAAAAEPSLVAAASIGLAPGAAAPLGAEPDMDPAAAASLFSDAARLPPEARDVSIPSFAKEPETVEPQPAEDRAWQTDAPVPPPWMPPPGAPIPAAAKSGLPMHLGPDPAAPTQSQPAEGAPEPAARAAAPPEPARPAATAEATEPSTPSMAITGAPAIPPGAPAMPPREAAMLPGPPAPTQVIAGARPDAVLALPAGVIPRPANASRTHEATAATPTAGEEPAAEPGFDARIEAVNADLPPAARVPPSARPGAPHGADSAPQPGPVREIFATHLQPISGPAAQAAATAEAAAIAPPSPVRQVLPLTIAMLISPGAAPTLSVTLEPGEMGQLEIRIGRNADGMTLRLVAERGETTAILQRDQRELQQGLAQSGFRLDAGAIQFETAGDGQQGAGQPRDRPPPRDRPARAAPSAAEPDARHSLLDLRI